MKGNIETWNQTFLISRQYFHQYFRFALTSSIWLSKNLSIVQTFARLMLSLGHRHKQKKLFHFKSAKREFSIWISYYMIHNFLMLCPQANKMIAFEKMWILPSEHTKMFCHNFSELLGSSFLYACYNFIQSPIGLTLGSYRFLW